MAAQDYEWYEELRGDLEIVRDEFENAVQRFSRPYHKLFRPLGMNTQMAVDGWGAFIAANPEVALGPHDEWERWEVFPDGSFCNRFWGHDSQDGLAEFQRLAGSAMRIVEAIRDGIAQGLPVPAGAKVELPFEGQDGAWPTRGHCGWIALLYETGKAYETTFLVVNAAGYWGLEDESTSDQIDDGVEEVACQNGGTPYLAHPAVDELQHDLFRSSADMIGVWLHPETMPEIGYGDGEPPVYLPPAQIPDVEEDGEHGLGGIGGEQLGIEEQAVGTGEPAPQPRQPRYDPDLRDLWVGDVLIKHYAQPSPNQIPILQAFQEEGWPPSIDDPLPWNANIRPKKRVNDTVRGLNEHHAHPNILRFHAARDGEAVSWELISDEAD